MNILKNKRIISMIDYAELIQKMNKRTKTNSSFDDELYIN